MCSCRALSGELRGIPPRAGAERRTAELPRNGVGEAERAARPERSAPRCRSPQWTCRRGGRGQGVPGGPGRPHGDRAAGRIGAAGGMLSTVSTAHPPLETGIDCVPRGSSADANSGSGGAQSTKLPLRARNPRLRGRGGRPLSNSGERARGHDSHAADPSARPARRRRPRAAIHDPVHHGEEARYSTSRSRGPVHRKAASRVRGPVRRISVAAAHHAPCARTTRSCSPRGGVRYR